MEARRFEGQLKALPSKPGVYLYKDISGNVLYVGKAANLHNRVSSYFKAPVTLSLKIQRLVAQASDFEFFVTDSEQEALCLLYTSPSPRDRQRSRMPSSA